MQIFATFEHSTYIELAISELEDKGINDIFALPLDSRTEERKLFDTLHKSDGTSLLDKAFAFAVAFAVIGASRGFALKWGPIYWGIIGGACGLVFGFLLDVIQNKVFKKKHRLLRGKQAEVILIVDCPEDKTEMVEKILWDNLAFGLAKVK
ncbi:hypothetical protein JOC86_000091 [Bacillus pakistanensis]|uniref:Uncharacterized protein n=1 Tax=Rossellomorea pakistanensis TaxID=992288 RepID=A0ABS2N6V3_9BACI|nr:hypothetical protein [Bacillus pakistanensis]MBM7583554.1 hypothetical protein [Bacillus pakistanensis]